MLKVYRLFSPIIFLACFANTFDSVAQKIRNEFYEVEVKGNVALVKHLESGQLVNISPKFTVVYREDNPQLAFKVKADRFMKQPIGAVRVPHWRNPNDDGQVADFFKAGTIRHLVAKLIKPENGDLKMVFEDMPGFSLSAFISLRNSEQPVVGFNFYAKQGGYYSIGFTGMPAYDPNRLTSIWQPPVWQEKRFPELSFLSTEDMCSSLPGTMVESKGLTTGVFADPLEIPFRLPYQPKGNIKMGVVVRNEEGRAQPMIFAPVLGNNDSRMYPGQHYAFKQRIFLYAGSQTDAFIYATKSVFGFKDYRKNVFTNLNQTIENMIDFQMDDVYSRWNSDLKGFDYSTDVADAVKNVSALHPLSVALITDHRGIYQRRALPMTEYLMSREKYLFSVNKEIKRQQPSSRMKGPAMEVAEVAALNGFFQKQSPVFAYFADSLSHTSRQLNLTKVSKGDDWPNLLALFKMTGNAEYLKKAKEKADEYIAWRIESKQTDFRDSGPVQAAQFWTDYAPLWMELLNLFEATGDKKYLNAAEEGAKLYLQYVWFYPKIPEGNIIVNKNGVVDFLCIEAVRDKIPRMSASTQTVPNWQVSQIGLTPEASNTISWNPAIFLSQFAPHYLRLAHHTGREFYRWVGRSAVVGRYTNYPGYDIDGEFNTVYSRPDYPLRYQHEVSYNQFYYNHVWPQIAMLFDYLISDVFASSKGNIIFPAEFSPSYAYLKSNVYGHLPGRFYGDENVRLWMPRQVLNVTNEQVNYLTGYGNDKFYMILLNQSDQMEEVEVRINSSLVPLKINGSNTARLWSNNGSPQKIVVKNGKLFLKLQAKGVAAVAIDSVPIVTQFQHLFNTNTIPSSNSFRRINSGFGHITSTIISTGQLSNVFVWLDTSPEDADTVTLHYRVAGDADWLKKTDARYPFEFSISLENSATFEFFIEAQLKNKEIKKTEKISLNK